MVLFLHCSTYSTLYNHPTRIVEPRTARVSSEIKLSRKTGMPLGVIPGHLPKENHPSKGEFVATVEPHLCGLQLSGNSIFVVFCCALNRISTLKFGLVPVPF